MKSSGCTSAAFDLYETARAQPPRSLTPLVSASVPRVVSVKKDRGLEMVFRTVLGCGISRARIVVVLSLLGIGRPSTGLEVACSTLIAVDLEGGGLARVKLHYV